MTYEERIAAAQAKMELFKTKMSAVGEKAKAARALRKEEIDAAIDEINDDIDELDAAFEAELADAEAEVEGDIAATIDEINDDIDELDAAFEAELADAEAEVEGDIAAAKENIRLAKERKDSKIYAIKLKAQMKAETLKEKIAARREKKDKIAIENYILDLIEYAEACEQVAFAAAIEADLALLEATAVAAEYVEKYGEAEVPEAPAEEAAE